MLGGVSGGVLRGKGRVDSLKWCRWRGGWIYGRHCRGVVGVAGENKEERCSLFVVDDAACGGSRCIGGGAVSFSQGCPDCEAEK